MSAHDYDDEDADQRTPPPFLPFLDQEEEYQHDPNTVRERAQALIDALDAQVTQLSIVIDMLEASLPPEQAAIIRHLRTRATELDDSADLMRALVRELITYNAQLTVHRQSARQAYNDGWRHRYEEILSMLHPFDQETLRQIIAKNQPPDDDLPF